jgi:peptidoglycan/LPS O-acetylase OafA/YrhL
VEQKLQSATPVQPTEPSIAFRHALMTTNTPAEKAAYNYRPEIDGLRAIAVFAVIIFHFSKTTLPGGFLGVDIFFVISGYVITITLISRSTLGLKAFMLEFYSRRIKRIMPALAFCVAVSSVLISFFSPIANDSLKAGLTALFGFSNLYFLQKDADYFGNTPELNIFTQTWSLGVEEQFYLIYPLLFWILLRSNSRTGAKPDRAISLFLSLIICSMVSFIVLTFYFPIPAFYLVFTRFWELGLGCLVALNESKLKEKLEGNWVMSALSRPLLILPLILLLLLLPVDYFVFTTVLIVFATAALITRIDRDSQICKLLSSKVAVYLGMMSFSLYLWHWTVLVISNWTVGISVATLPIQIIIVFAVSAFSYHCLERPMRKKKWSNSLSTTVFYGISSGVIVSFLIVSIYLAGGIYLGDREVNLTKGCQNSLKSPHWISGDSHASIYALLLSDIYKGDCTFLSETEATGNSFLFSRTAVPKASGKPFSKAAIEVALKDPSLMIELINKYKPSVLFIAVYWNGYFLDNSKFFESASHYIHGYKGADGASLQRERALALYLENIRQLSVAIKGTTDIIVLLPEPDFNWTRHGVVRGECNPQWFMTVKYPPPLEEICKKYLSPATMTKQEFSSRSGELSTAINRVLGGIENVRFFDIADVVCINDLCSTHHQGLRYYMDDDHISSLGLEKVRPSLLQSLSAGTRPILPSSAR